MYSPKISEDLIPRIYRMAKFRKMPMTKLVNQILKEQLDDIDVVVHAEKGSEIPTEKEDSCGNKPDNINNRY